MTEYWDSLLKDMRTALNSSCQETNNIIRLCESHFDEISHLLLLEYVSNATACVDSSHPRKLSSTTLDRGNFQTDENSSSSPSLSLIASNVYRALRFVLVALSCPISATRERVQLLAISTLLNKSNNNDSKKKKKKSHSDDNDTIHDTTTNPPIQPLYISIYNLIAQPRIHTKNRNLAAKILCNIGTCNRKTARVLLCGIRSSPEVTTCTSTISTICWSELIHMCGRCGDRGSLAAVVAALYNAIHSFLQDVPLTHEEGDAADGDDDDMVKYIKSVYIPDAMLLSNLIRYILPCQVIQPTTYAVGKDDNGQQDLSDDATEWISRLMEKFSSMGLLPLMYVALGGQGEEAEVEVVEADKVERQQQQQQQPQNQHSGMLPEQLVLLHCIGSSLDEYERNFPTLKQTREEIMMHPLGHDLESIKKSCQFLAQLYCNLRQRIRCKENIQERYDGEISCIQNGCNVILDVLSSFLSTSSSSIVEPPYHQEVDLLRRELGQSTNIVKVVVEDLGMIVDRLDSENRETMNARELFIHPSDQHHVTSLVRLIANVCYQCQWNQDLVRLTPVPLFVKENDDHDSRRNGLHALLSCTSFAYGCFTLREWAIVAIRNVLEDNHENQKQVEELEAHQALNTPELEKLGVQVHLDRKGHVVVSPKE